MHTLLDIIIFFFLRFASRTNGISVYSMTGSFENCHNNDSFFFFKKKTFYFYFHRLTLVFPSILSN